MSKKASVWLLIGIIILSALNFIYRAETKEGYHMDEIYTMGLANSQFHYDVCDESGSIRWNTPEDFDTYLTVTDQHTFDYENVYKNQVGDVHPPLFYFIVHTIASHFPGTASAYFAILPNIVFALATLVFLYLIAMYVFRNRTYALLTVLLYSISTGCVNMVIYVRMYSMLAFFTTAILYLHIRLHEHNYSLTPALAIAIAASVFFGALTQYYFFIFMAIVAGFASYTMLRKKLYKKLMQYFGLMIIVAGIYILIWPSVFSHLFFSSRGEEAFSNVTNLSFIKSFLWYLNAIREGMGTLILALFVTLLFMYLIKLIKIWRSKNKSKLHQILENNSAAFSILLVTICYLLIVVAIAPYQTMRYITPIFPLLTLLFMYTIRQAIKNRIYHKVASRKTILAVTAIFITVGVGASIYESFIYKRINNIPISVHYPVSDELRQVFDKHGNSKCVMIHSYYEQYLWNFQDYRKFSATAFVPPERTEEFFNNNPLSDEKEIVLCVSSYIDYNSVANEIANKLGFKCKFIADSQWRNFTKIYLLYRE